MVSFVQQAVPPSSGRSKPANTVVGLKDDLTNKIAGSVATENGLPLVVKACCILTL